MSIGTLGYVFGHTLELILEDIKRYEVVAFLVLGLIGVATWIVYFLRQRSQP